MRIICPSPSVICVPASALTLLEITRTLVQTGCGDTTVTGKARREREHDHVPRISKVPLPPPLSIGPQGLRGGTIQLAASVSSQYVSSILLCVPYAQHNVRLELTGRQVNDGSRSG